MTMRPRLRAPLHRLLPRVLYWTALLAAVVGWVLPAATATASAAATKVVRYHGYRLVVPAAWPVFTLAGDPSACVRFDRHAVYLGQPGAAQRCPAQAAGRTEAILVGPLGSVGAGILRPARAGRASGSEAQIVNTAHRVVVTATWNRDPSAIERALGVRSAAAVAALTSRPRPASQVTAAITRAHAMARARAADVSTPGQVYTGSGFDACSTPSSSQMAAWGASPYRALGVYIGGTNMACSQPNLSATWVSAQSAAGWHLIPIYVGLQAPSNSCGCASISASSAAAEGTSAAQDAVADAQAIGLGAGNPIYDDMEAYSRSSTNTSAVLAFLSAWTTTLHAGGYASGIYSSDDSGIDDLVAQMGTGYAEPDDIWIANWNGSATTSDPNVPGTDWAAHQRLHQYRGAHNESYGGATINIDGDYLDAATAAAGTATGYAAPTPPPSPSLSVRAGPDGSIDLTPSWSGATGVTGWQVLAGNDPSALTWIGPAAASGRVPIVTRNTFSYFQVEALGTGGQVLGASVPAPTPPHVAIFGQAVFAPRRGLAGLPVGCFGMAACVIKTTVSLGRSTLSSTGYEYVNGSGGLAYFKLTPSAQTLLTKAVHHQLTVKVKVVDSSGSSASRTLVLHQFATSDPSPHRSLGQSPALHFIGTTDFISHGWVGGILAACTGSAPCLNTATIVSGGKVIARGTQQTMGAGESAYVFFSLTAAGHRLLIHTKANQLGATVTMTTTLAGAAPATTTGTSGTGGATGIGGAPGTSSSGSTETAHIALVSY
jgi:hypothetical protein